MSSRSQRSILLGSHYRQDSLNHDSFNCLSTAWMEIVVLTWNGWQGYLYVLGKYFTMNKWKLYTYSNMESKSTSPQLRHVNVRASHITGKSTVFSTYCFFSYNKDHTKLCIGRPVHSPHKLSVMWKASWQQIPPAWFPEHSMGAKSIPRLMMSWFNYPWHLNIDELYKIQWYIWVS